MNRKILMVVGCFLAMGGIFACENLNITGEWFGSNGEMVILENHDLKITGTYQYTDDDGIKKIGSLEGDCYEKNIQGQWWEYPAGLEHRPGFESRGDFEWKISADGKGLNGWYREDGERDPGEIERHEWNLER